MGDENHVLEDLTALCDGELSELDRTRVEEHLASCRVCAKERANLADGLARLRLAVPPVPSAALRRRVLDTVSEDPAPTWGFSRLFSLLTPRLVVPCTALAVAALVLFSAGKSDPPAVASAEELDIAANLELLEDYEVLALNDVPAEDLEVVAHLHELSE
jgi:anti-sigma factor RsiW